VNNIARVCRGVVITLGRPARNATTDARIEKFAQMLRPLTVLPENGFGGAFVSVVDVVVGVPDSVSDSVAASTSLLTEDEVSLRMPTTEKAVENKVKKNPTTITVAILRTCVQILCEQKQCELI